MYRVSFVEWEGLRAMSVLMMVYDVDDGRPRWSCAGSGWFLFGVVARRVQRST